MVFDDVCYCHQKGTKINNFISSSVNDSHTPGFQYIPVKLVELFSYTGMNSYIDVYLYITRIVTAILPRHTDFKESR